MEDAARLSLMRLQNHNNFLKTADGTIRVVSAVNSEWFGVILDVGGLRENDPCPEIEKLVPYAISWPVQGKRRVQRQGGAG